MKHPRKKENNKDMDIEQMKSTLDVPVNHDGTDVAPHVLNDKAGDFSLALLEKRKVNESLVKNQEAINKELEALKNQLYAAGALTDQSEIRQANAGESGLMLETPHKNPGSGPKMKLRNEPKSAWKL